MRCFVLAGILGGFMQAAAGAALPELRFEADDIRTTDFVAEQITAHLSGADWTRVEIQIGKLRVREHAWTNVKLTCSAAVVNATEIGCKKGRLELGRTLPVSFRYLLKDRFVELRTGLTERETVHVTANLVRQTWQARVSLDKSDATQLNPWLPKDFPQTAGGTVTGTAEIQGDKKGLVASRFDLAVAGLQFSDQAGLRAGDGVAGVISGKIDRRNEGWKWSASVDWREGEVFWQPLYLPGGGHQLHAQGDWTPQAITVDQAALSLGGIGTAQIQARWDRTDKRLASLEVNGRGLELAQFYPVVLKPFLERTMLADLEAEGRIDMRYVLRAGQTQSFDIALHQVDIRDKRKRFAIHNLNGSVPWDKDTATAGQLSIEGGQMFKVPLGEVAFPFQAKGLELAIPKVVVPVLGGELTLEDFRAAHRDGEWTWRFSGGLTPLSMSEITTALGVPEMLGTLSGVIPEVRYRHQTLTVDGALLIKVFDGTAVIKDLQMIEPFGRAPRLGANVDMRNLDLDLLTRAFSFGSMEGKIDISLDKLQLVNWQPVQFDALVRSSPGRYRKRISQRAVQNISSLGGAGAAAAIQRSFLSFFKTFGYSEIGLSCVLRNGICVMDGVQNVANGGFVIIKGGGIPALTVIGYNRQVDWNELIKRIKRVTEGDVKPVVR